MIAAAATVLPVSGPTWPTPEQVRDVLRDEPGFWSILGDILGGVWAEPAGRIAVVVLVLGVVALFVSFHEWESDPDAGWPVPVGVAGCVALLAGLVLLLVTGSAGARERTAQLWDEFRAGQVEAAGLLAGPLDQERPGWVVAVPDEDGQGPRIEVQRLNEGLSSWLGEGGPVVVRLTALDETGAQHACTYTPAAAEESPAVGPDGATSVTRQAAGGLDCETQEGH